MKQEKKMNNADRQYQDLLKTILEHGSDKTIRAGEVRSYFGTQMRFNLREGFPLLTTKKMYTKGIIYELLWFINGDTNIKYLVDNNVNIWNGDAYRYYLGNHKKYNLMEPLLSIEEFVEEIKNSDGAPPSIAYDKGDWIRLGDLGPVYGKQWRNWNGYDQLENVVNTLKTNPDNTRIIINSWNVGELGEMALPPCHVMSQFYTRELTDVEKQQHPNKERELSCLWTQRSCDFPLGIPYNIASYAFLTHMLAHVTNMTVGDLIFSGGDSHVYLNQMDGIKEQLSRDPNKYNPPTLELNPEVKKIGDFKYEDIKVKNYESYPKIDFPLSVGL